MIDRPKWIGGCRFGEARFLRADPETRPNQFSRAPGDRWPALAPPRWLRFRPPLTATGARCCVCRRFGCGIRRSRHANDPGGIPPLFDRIGRRVRLTSAGRDYLDAMSRAFDGMAEATRRLTEASAVKSLTVNALPTFSMRWLLPRLAGFQQRHPDVALRLVTSDRPLDEAREPFDVAIRRGPDIWPDCDAAPFLAEWEVPVMSPALAARQPVRHAADLAGHTLLHADTRPGAWRR